MTLTQIQYFLELCSTKNYTRAAQNLYITQPTLSRQIQLMEAELEVKLLNRTNREVELTEAGKCFLEEFTKIQEQIDAAFFRVKSAGKKKEAIRVGFSGALFPFHVLNFVGKMREYFPGYHVLINQYSDYELHRDFNNGTIDILISLEDSDYLEKDIQDNKADSRINKYKFWDLPAYIVYSSQMFPEGYYPTIEDFRSKKFACTSKTGSNFIIEKQKSILASICLNVTEEIKEENIPSSLMFGESKDIYSVFINSVESGLETLELPGNAKKFNLVAYWKSEDLPYLDFFESSFERK